MNTPAYDWVTQDELRTWVTMDGLAHPHWYRASILHAMMLDVRPCLGKPLYEAVNAQILTGTLTPANAQLREYWAPAVAHYTMYHSGINGLNMRVEDIGLMQNQDPTTITPSAQDVAYWRQEMKNRAEAYKRLALEFMRVNYLDYPLWVDYGKCKDDACRKPDHHFEFYVTGQTRPPLV